MQVNRKRIILGALILMTLMVISGFTLNRAQQPQLSVRQRFVVSTMNQRCEPARVKSVFLGKQPQDVLIGQIAVENRSAKTITAVKLAWKVYSYDEGIVVPLAACNAPTKATVLLSGTTPLIELGMLAAKETITVSINPLVLPMTETKTVFVDHPFLTVGEVETLTDASEALSHRYAALMSIKEIHFEDGTTLTLENN